MQASVYKLSDIGISQGEAQVPLGGDEVQTLIKFVNLPSPHPQPLSHWERVAEGRVRGQSPMEP